MEKKLRIQLFDEESRLVDDRTVVQGPELSSGPTITHQGLFRIEFTLDCKDDVEKAKIYLDQLIGNLPIGSKKIRKELMKELSDPNQREMFLEKALALATDQDVLIKFLRDNEFKFMMWDFLKIFEFPIVIKEHHQERYQWMLRKIKEAKNPKADKYDPTIIFGIQLLPEHNEKIVVYLNGEFQKIYKVPVPSKPREVFKKTEMMKFPPYMTEEEREKFRYEIRQYQNDPKRIFSKFFVRWRPYVENILQLPQDKKEEVTE